VKNEATKYRYLMAKSIEVGMKWNYKQIHKGIRYKLNNIRNYDSGG